MLKLLIFFVLLNIVTNSAQTPYECGLHGRFEYCINGIPGCIVGCHCHPGYYFDTETKICEPSSKMFHDSRGFYSPPLPGIQRQHATPQSSLPPRLSLLHSPQQLPQDLPKSPAQSELLSEIAEYVSDDQQPSEKEKYLEDWLYEQFSKNIESQILNKNGNKLSRRSGGGSRPVTPSTSSKARAKKKTKKSKLRTIDENDSIFEDVSSEEDNASKDSGEKDKEECKNEGKKMIIIKKRPKMPLPPFIFMPQNDGSYYPASGLAPPPPMTLFPIVPVPPMMPMIPMMPPPQNLPCNNTPTANPTAPNTNVTTTTASQNAPNTDVTTPTADTLDTSTNGDNTSQAKNSFRARKRKRKPLSPFFRANDNVRRIPSATDNLAGSSGGGGGGTIGDSADAALLNNMQSPLFNPRARELRKNINNAAMIENLSSRRSAVGDFISDIEPDDPAPGFQYLTDLIHTFDSPTKPVRPMNYNSFGLVPKKKVPVSTDDSYFTNLGREIVTLMNQMDIVKSASASGGARSLSNARLTWDRQVRSPSPKPVELKPNTVKSSEDLLHLERDVYEAATSAPALSLTELEERIRKVDEEFINLESDIQNEEDSIVLKQSHLENNLPKIQKINIKAKPSESLLSHPIQSVHIHSELRNSEPHASASIHFELRHSDSQRPVAPIRPETLPVLATHIPNATTSTKLTSTKQSIVHVSKPLKSVFQKPQKQRHPTPQMKSPSPNHTTPSSSNNPQQKPLRQHKEEKRVHKNRSQVISTPVIHKEPRHSQASYSPPKLHRKHKTGPHSISKILKNHHLLNNNKMAEFQTYNFEKTSLFGNNFGHDIQQNDFEDNPAAAAEPSKPPFVIPFYHPRASYEKWEFDKQQFSYPKLSADLNELNKLRYINAQHNIQPEEFTTTTVAEEPVIPVHHKLYRQYFFPYSGTGISFRRDYEVPSWYFDTR